MTLVKTEQVEGVEYAEEGGFGAEKLAHTKAVGRQIVFEFLDTLLDAGPPVVVAPDDLGGFAAIGDEDAECVAGHLDEPTADRRFVLTLALAQHHEASRHGPSVQF